MKTFFMIAGVLAILSAGLVMYFYQNLIYQPEEINNTAAIDIYQNEQIARGIADRLQEEFTNEKYSILTGEELKNLIFYILHKKDKTFIKAMKTLKCTIKDEHIILEGLLNIEGFRELNIGPDIKRYYDALDFLLPDGKRELYFSLTGTPQKHQRKIVFREGLILKLGNFEQKVHMDGSAFAQDTPSLSFIEGFSSIEFVGDKIKIIW